MSPHGGSAVALGLFDGVHLGHRAVLAMTAACAIAQQLTPCAFTFAADSIPAKQGVPLAFLYTDAQKRRLMQACGIAHVYCPTFSALRHLDGEAFCRHVLVEMLHAREVFCGDDFRFGAGAAWDVEALERFGAAMGFRVHRVPPVRWGTQVISSTAIRQAVRSGEMEQAQKLLGAPYQICGAVTHGKSLGHTRQVPTINLPFASGQLVPRHGVYVSYTRTSEGGYDSITNVGINPTVSDSQPPVAETYLLHFSGDLYDQPCQVELRHFLRAEQKFPDTDALYAQIAADQAACRQWLTQHPSGEA